MRPGGWAFQYNNAYYPDLDDTAVVVMSMDRMRREHGATGYDAAIDRGREWIQGMQSDDGGWAAFDVNNLEYYLNNIPFSDHGALLDPPTEDVTARCISMLAQLGETAKTTARGRRGRLPQEDPAPGGSWYGRWGMNFIYGTWSVLCALNMAGVRHDDPPDDAARPPTGWPRSRTRTAAGARTRSATAWTARAGKPPPRPLPQTAWALLALDGGRRG